MNILREIKQIKTQSGGWYNKNFHAWFHPFFGAAYGASTVAIRRLPVYSNWGTWLVNSNNYDWFWSKKALHDIGEWLINNNRKNLNHFDLLLKQWEKDWLVFQKYRKWFEANDIKKLSNNELADKYQKLFDSYVWVNSLPYLADGFLAAGESDVVTKKLTAALGSKLSPRKLMEVVQILTTPVYDSFVNQSHKSLLKIALLISNKPTLKKTLVKRGVKQISKLLSEYRVIKNEIDSFENNYHWIHNNYYNVQRLGVDYVLGEIRHMLVRKENIKAALKKENNVQKANRLMKVKLIKEYGLTKELVNLIRLSEKVTRWQDDRKAVVYQINPIMFRVFREVGGRFSLPWQKVAMGTDKEIVALLKTGKYPKEEWKKRRHRATVIHTKKGYKILTGKKAELLMIKDLSMKLDDRKLLKGIIACPGIAKGVVRITNNTKSIKLIKKGEVLVANNTTPDYVPAMKKAAAVVTEQGGITGHASIVSRELNIPCIVGVEGITKVLKNGQKVEVNAIRGIINIL